MSSEQVQSFFAIGIGFAVAGLLATGYQLLTSRPMSFKLLQQAPRTAALAAVPILVLAAPFIIMRNTILGSEITGRPMQLVMIATVIAGVWSLMSGSVMVMALNALCIAAG